MKVNVNNIVRTAKGAIDEKLLTGTGSGGPISTGYLSTRPVVDYLEPDERLNFLIDNWRDGLDIDDSGEQRTVRPDPNFRTMAAVTTKRVLFIIGRENGDRVREVPVDEITASRGTRGVLKNTLYIRTNTTSYRFPAREKWDVISIADHISELAAADEHLSTTIEERGGRNVSHAVSEKTETERGQPQRMATDGSCSRESESQQLPPGKPSQGESGLVARLHDLKDGLDDPGLDPSDAKRRANHYHSILRRVASVGFERIDEGIAVDEELESTETTIETLDELETRIERIDDVLPEAENRIVSLESASSEALSTVEEQLQACIDISANADLSTDTYEQRLEEVQRCLDERGSSERDRLLRAVEETAEGLGKVPTYTEMQAHGEVSVDDLYEYFDSWDEILDATAIDVRQELLEELAAIGETLGRRPSQSAFEEASQYRSSRYQNYFDSWDAALDASGIDRPTDETLLSDLRDLRDTLDKIPRASDMDTHGCHDSRQYIDRFGDWGSAVSAAGFDLESALIDGLRNVATIVEGVPTTTDADEHGTYRSHRYYQVFENWGEAREKAGVESEANVRTLLANDTANELPRNELAEWYEAVGSLSKTLTAVVEALDLDPSAPTAAWQTAVHDVWNGNGWRHISASYGEQQATRSVCSISEYRDEFGDGKTVTNFATVTAVEASETVQKLIARADVDAPDPIVVPETPDDGIPLPVIVESDAELERAYELLAQLPAEPDVPVDETRSDEPIGSSE